jgi:hypothetical protein
MKEEGRRKKEVLKWGLEPQLKTGDLAEGWGIKKNSEDKLPTLLLRTYEATTK